MEATTSPDVIPITARVLPAEEWSRLTQPELRALDPAHAIVVVVERDGPGGEILGEWAALTTVHLEGLLSSEPGNPGIARGLLTCMTEALLHAGVREVLTQVTTPEVEALCQHLTGAQQIPGATWVIPLG
ncbi:MAG TPA: hypothetical protein VIM84_14790 [Gemmatimonadales bacterium]